MLAKNTDNLHGTGTLVAGLVFILLLIFVIVGVSRIQIDSSQSDMDFLVENHMQKLRLVSEMRVAARERTLSLYKIIQLRDAFERDEEWMIYNANATRFAEARLALITLPLTIEERQILDDQGRFTGETVPLQDKIVDLAMNENLAAAKTMMSTQAVPSQDRVLAKLDELSRIQEKAAAVAVRDAQAWGLAARNWIILLGTLVIAISSLVAIGITLRTRQHQRVLRREKDKAQITLFSIGEGVVTTDADGLVESLNPTAEVLTGWSLEQAKGRKLVEVFSLRNDIDKKVVGELFQAVLQGTSNVVTSDDIILVRKDDKEYTVEATAAPIFDDQHHVIGSVIVFRDVTEVRALSLELVYQARHDALTAIFNRHEFERRLQIVLARARATNEVSALCYLDLDLFKVINDTSGHAAGDELLKQIANLIHKQLRRDDIVARLGGDEFGVLLNNCDLKKAEILANSIRQSIVDFRFVWEDNSHELGVSIGVVPVEPDSGTLYDVMRAADVACYAAKDRGRNQVCVYSADDLTLVRRQGEMGWVQQIRQAMEQNRFCLAFQLITPLRNGDKPLVEILVRIESANRLITPTIFMPAAERYHLAPSIDRWVIENSIKFITSLPAPVRESIDCFCINLSGQSLSEPDMLVFVDRIFTEYGMSPEKICFEITETAAITNLTSASVFMEALKKQQCRFSLDDFGSGLSSFAYLKTLPVDYLKIDGTFVREIATDETDMAMVSSINQVSHIIGIRTVAEYVESEVIRKRVQRIGIDYAQGNYIGEPVPLTRENLVNQTELTGDIEARGEKEQHL